MKESFNELDRFVDLAKSRGLNLKIESTGIEHPDFIQDLGYISERSSLKKPFGKIFDKLVGIIPKRHIAVMAAEKDPQDPRIFNVYIKIRPNLPAKSEENLNNFLNGVRLSSHNNINIVSKNE